VDKRDPNRAFGFLMSDITRLMRRDFARRAQPLDMTEGQWRVLARLSGNEGLSQAGWKRPGWSNAVRRRRTVAPFSCFSRLGRSLSSTGSGISGTRLARKRWQVSQPPNASS
jgi:hypothetical protein